MNLYVIVKLLHILAAFWFISGVVGRDFAFWRAGKATNVQAVNALLQISDFFERYAVIPISMAVFVFGLIITLMQRWPLFGFLQGSAINWLLISFLLFLGISLAIGPLKLIPRRKERTRALEEALAHGMITPALTAALNDQVVVRFREVELIILIIIIVLMVTKPF
jgi:uncharacterized membrane protein